MADGDPSFPERLVEVGEGSRATATSGFGRLLVAVGLVAYPIYCVANPPTAGFSAVEVLILVALVGAAVACVVYEVRSTRRPVVLIRIGGRIGVYRAGTLESVLTRRVLLQQRVSTFGTLRGMLAAAVLAFGFVAYGLNQEGGPLAVVVATLPGVYVVLVVIWWIRASRFCVLFYLPPDGAKSLFSREALGEIVHDDA